MFYAPDNYLQATFEKYKEFYFVGYEWVEKISYKIVENFDQLIDQDDIKKWHDYFVKHVPIANTITNNRNPMIKRGYYFLKNKFFRFTNFLKNKLPPQKIQAQIHKTAQIEKRELIEIAKTAEIKDYVIIRAYTKPVIIGEFTQINPFTVIYGHSEIKIGNNVMIGPHCMIAAGNHDYLQTEKPMRFAGALTKGPIIIEDNVWIGANSTITDGVTIGRDAVVGANSVVTANVNPFEIVAGTPAKVIGKRK
jgi:acetyltransferase-like isoleucine patch superfamily enzyme